MFRVAKLRLVASRRSPCPLRMLATKEFRRKDWVSNQFWEEYYKRRKQGQSFDWFINDKDALKRAASFVASLRGGPEVDPGRPFRVLHVGCGTSALSEALFHCLEGTEEAYELIHSDYSQLAVSELRSRMSTLLKENHRVVLSDLLNLSGGQLEGKRFDVVVDKGCIDAFVQSNDEEKLKRALKSIENLLFECGTLCMITNDDVFSREGVLGTSGSWDIGRLRQIKLCLEDAVDETSLIAVKMKRVCS